jgi:O-acetylserine/cysteine efflux transporter
MAPRHLVLLLFTMVIWGLNIVANKVVVDIIPPLYFTAVRFVIVFACIFPWLKIVPGRMKQVFVLAMLIGGIHFALFFISLRLARDASVLAIVTQLNMPLVALAGIVFLGERIGWRRAAAMVGAFVGVVIIAFDPRVFSYIGAVLIMVVAQIDYALAAVYLRRLQGIGAMQLLAWNTAFAMPVLFALSFLFENNQWASLTHMGLLPWGCLLFSALGGTVLGHTVMMFMYQRYPVTQVVIYTLVSPITAVISGVLLLHDHMSAKIAIGGLVTLGSIAFYFLRAKKVAEQAATDVA